MKRAILTAVLVLSACGGVPEIAETSSVLTSTTAGQVRYSTQCDGVEIQVCAYPGHVGEVSGAAWLACMSTTGGACRCGAVEYRDACAPSGQVDPATPSTEAL